MNNFTSYETPRAVAGTQEGTGAPALIWDQRSILDTPPDLRLYRYIPAGDCTLDSHCTWAGAGSTCDTAFKRCVDTKGSVVGKLEFAPFLRGPAPGVYGDYDDWLGLQWGFCRSRQDASSGAPDFVNGYVPTSYRGTLNCGPVPVFPEPDPSGGMAYTSVPGPDDELYYPWLYEPREYDCDPASDDYYEF